MLRVPTFVAPSAIAGVGLFAATELPAGTVIWEFTEGVDWRITPGEFAEFPEPFRSRLRHYVYQEESGTYVLCGDNAKFMNHADEPNCDDPEGEYTITRRLVHAGEELTCDYRSFDLESRELGLGYFESEGHNGNGVTASFLGPPSAPGMP
jgi:uncharacterized protein